jgi:predicted nucleic acid-binding protein
VNIALDSSVLVALLDPNDVLHGRALALQAGVLQVGSAVVYFDCVVAESISAVARRLHEKGRGAEIEELLDRLVTLVGCRLSLATK